MSCFSVKTNVKGQTQTLLSVSNALAACGDQVRYAQSALLSRNTTPYQLINSLNGAAASLNNISRKARDYANGLTDAVNAYEQTEWELLGLPGSFRGLPNIDFGWLKDLIGPGTPAEEGTRSWFAKFINNELKVSGAVLAGEMAGTGTFLGFDTEGKLSGSLVYGEAKVENKANFKFKDENGKFSLKSVGISSEASASGGLAKGEAEGSIGYLHGKVKGEAITGAAKAEVKATFYEDGRFNPSLRAGVKAEGSVLKGKADAGFGTDQFGINASASGDVLHAEAGAEAGVGYLGKDKNGNPRYGVQAKASALASVAQGKVSGGVTIFGIDIDVNLKGYAGAAGVEAGCGVTTNGAKFNLGGALALGAGVDVSIDWGDAKWIGDGIDAASKWVGETADNVGSWIGSAADSTGKFFSGLFSR